MLVYYELKKSTKDVAQPYYFVLKAANHEIIATSEMYASKQSALKGIASVQTNGPSETIKDLTA